MVWSSERVAVARRTSDKTAELQQRQHTGGDASNRQAGWRDVMTKTRRRKEPGR